MCSSDLSACLTDPPPDLPLYSQAPTILIDAVVPPEGPIVDLPPGLEFVVPVIVEDPSAACAFDVYLDGALIQESSCDANDFDAGIAAQHFLLPETVDPLTCHRIVFSLGTDLANWTYVPPTCVVYDAGTLQSGAFPDAATDGLLLVPDAEAAE